jgi:hypothetical protein
LAHDGGDGNSKQSSGIQLRIISFVEMNIQQRIIHVLPQGKEKKKKRKRRGEGGKKGKR